MKALRLGVRKHRVSLLIRISAIYYLGLLLLMLPIYLVLIQGLSISEAGFSLFIMFCSFGFVALYYKSNHRNIVLYPLTGLYIQLLSILIIVFSIIQNDFNFLQFGIITGGISFGITLPQSMQLAIEHSSKNLRGFTSGVFCTVSFAALSAALGFSSVILVFIKQVYSTPEQRLLSIETCNHLKRAVQELTFFELNNPSTFIGILSNETFNWVLLAILISGLILTLASIFYILEWNKVCENSKGLKIVI